MNIGKLGGTPLMLAAALALSLAVYVQTLGYEFVYDDIPLVRENPAIRNVGNIPGMFLEEDSLDGVPTGYYRPLIPVIDLVVYQVFGAYPAAFHAASIIYHLACVAMVFFLALRLLREPGAALVASLFFGLHPVNTEAVAFITGKNNVLSALFVLAAAAAFFRYRDTGKKSWLGVSVALYVPGLLAKEFSLMLPFVLAAYEYGSPGGPRRPLVYVPYAAAAALYLGARSLVVSGVLGDALLSADTFERVLFVPELLMSYLRLVFLPFGQKALYDIAVTPDAGTAVSAVLLAGIVALVYHFRSRRWPVLAAVWFFLFLVPVWNILPVSGAAMAERYLYVPMAGAGLLVGGMYVALRPGRARVAAAAVVLVALALLTVLRTPVWRDDEALYTDMVRTTPTAYKGYYNLGNLKYRRGELREAARLWSRAIEVRPDMMAVHNNLGVVFEELGQYERAEKHYRAVMGVRTMPEVSRNLAHVLRRQGRFDEAAGIYRNLLALSDEDVEAYLGLSELHEERGDVDQAVAVLEEAIRHVPEEVEPYNRAGTILGERGRYEEAAGYFRRALEKDPGCARCRRNLDLVERLLRERNP